MPYKSEELIKRIEAEYKQFMGLTSFPEYRISGYSIKLNEVDLQGYACAARAEYDHSTKRHILCIPNYKMPKYLLFHEFTHINDMELLANGDDNHDCCLSGYMEYHASQVELMLLLGAKSIDDVLSFSMKDCITTGNLKRSVLDFLYEKLNLAIDIIDRNYTIVETYHIKDGLGAFYNYMGLRSICKMYATDYVEFASYRTFADRLGTNLFTNMNNHMNGWIDINEIDKNVIQYNNVFVRLVESYGINVFQP